MTVRWYIVSGLMVSMLLALRASGYDRVVVRAGYRGAAALDRWWSR